MFILSCMYVNHLRLSASILKLLLTYLLKMTTITTMIMMTTTIIITLVLVMYTYDNNDDCDCHSDIVGFNFVTP